MIHEHWAGAVREVSWGELQDLANATANVLASLGVARGDRVAVVLPPTPETAAVFFATWKLGALLFRCRCSTATRDPPPDRRFRAHGARHRRRQRGPLQGGERGAPAGARRAHLRRRADGVRDARHRGRRPGTAVLHLGHDRPGEGDRPRPPLPARARGVRLLPRRPAGRALPRHGRVGVGRRHLPAAGPVAPRRGAVRVPARGGLRSPQAARLPLSPRRHERLRHADGDPLDDVDRRRAHALPAALPHRLLGR